MNYAVMAVGEQHFYSTEQTQSVIRRIEPHTPECRIFKKSAFEATSCTIRVQHHGMECDLRDAKREKLAKLQDE